MSLGTRLQVPVPSGWLQVVAGSALLCGVLWAQDVRSAAGTLPFATPQTPAAMLNSPTQNTMQEPVAIFSLIKSEKAEFPEWMAGTRLSAARARAADAFDGPRSITLEEAQAQAQSADNPMARLGQLQVEAARQHRMGAESDYFPKISSTLTNFHFNKFMGQEVTITRPIAGTTSTLGLPLAGKDQTLVAVTAAQPLTPLFKLREVVVLARADENIARAKAGMPVAEISSNVEKNYYGLLVAQRQLEIARAEAEQSHGRALLASNGAVPGELKNAAVTSHDAEELDRDKAVVLAESKVKELTASLNLLLGYPIDTQLELATPKMEFEDISLKEAADTATTANPEVIEAEQTLVKARAGDKLAKLDYVPDIAVLGGYAYNDNALPLLPRDFSFIGIMGSFNVFDFGKREHTLKERNAQVSAATLGVQLTKAKVAASVKNSYFAMERARQLSELAHRMASAVELQRTDYSPGNAELVLTKAKLEVEMLQADLEYRQSLTALKTAMGGR